MPEADKLKRRVRSLLEVAKPNSGATPAERATARKLADLLMATNHWTEKDIPLREVECRRAPPPPPPQYEAAFVFVFNAGGGYFDFGFDQNQNRTTGW